MSPDSAVITPRPRDFSANRSALWNAVHSVDTEAPAGAQSIQRALVLLNLVGLLGRTDPRGVQLAELTRTVGLTKPTVHRVLSALAYAGFVDQDPKTQRYRLGVAARVLGQLAGHHDDGLHEFARDSLMRLALLCEDATFLTVRQGSYGICTHREEGTGHIRNHALAVGDRHPLGVGAGSLAILAGLSDNEIGRVLALNEQLLELRYPLLDAATMRELIDRTRVHGYALNDGKVVPGSWAIGVPIHNADGRPVAALSIGTIEQRLGAPRQRELALALSTEARRIESQLADTRAQSDLTAWGLTAGEPQ